MRPGKKAFRESGYAGNRAAKDCFAPARICKDKAFSEFVRFYIDTDRILLF